MTSQTVKPRRLIWRRLGSAGIVALTPMAALAQSDTDRTALLDRIQMLERRLEQIERASARPPQPPRGAARAVPPVAAQAPVSPPATAPQPTLPAASPARARDPLDEEVPQEAFVFRDQAITLRPGRAEASVDVGYARDRRTITSDRSITGVVAARLGIADGVEAAIALPMFLATRSFEFGTNNVSDRETRSLGDMSLQFNLRGWGERAVWPGAIFNLAAIAPTGPSPFINPIQGLNAAQVPVDITQLLPSRGAWAVRGGVQFFKTVDPIVLFAGVSYEYAFPVEQSGITFRPGYRIAYNAGMSFALSERSTLGLTFIGSYTSALGAEGFRYRTSATETGVMRFNLIQRVARSAWIEPSIGIGLVAESPNMQLGLGLRYRF